jgi:hypothetical protein
MDEKKRRLNRTLDALNERFGDSSVKKASLLEKPPRRDEKES